MNTSSSALVHTGARTASVSSMARRVLQGLCATIVVAIAAHIAFPLPFTPVPFTLQPLAVLGVGLALGPVDGCLAMLAYLAEGAAGLPVFSPTGIGGVAQLFGATGGFLMAYPLVAFLSGGLTRRLQVRLSSFTAALSGCTLAVVLLFVCGASWLARVAHLTPKQVFVAAVLPFLPGEAIKIIAAAGTYRALKPSRIR